MWELGVLKFSYCETCRNDANQCIFLLLAMGSNKGHEPLEKLPPTRGVPWQSSPDAVLVLRSHDCKELAGKARKDCQNANFGVLFC